MQCAGFPQISEGFSVKIYFQAIRESFLPRKKPAVLYIVLKFLSVSLDDRINAQKVFKICWKVPKKLGLSDIFSEMKFSLLEHIQMLIIVIFWVKLTNSLVMANIIF